MTIHLDKGGDLNDPNNDRCHIFIPGEHFLTATNLLLAFQRLVKVSVILKYLKLTFNQW